MEIALESLDGQVDTVIVAKTSHSICGGMKTTNCLEIRDQLKHLKNIPFPKLGKRSKIDMLIGSDYYNLLFPVKEVHGGDGEPSARLCPLGWTAIGTIDVCEQHESCSTGFLHTYRMQKSDAKRAIAAVLSDAEVSDEELEMIFAGVESLLNSRPLTTVSDDPNDNLVLTPNHFLIGQMGDNFVPESVDSTPFNLSGKRWRRVQELTRHV
ncbi:hypothetical protein AWC38_SpisGene14574 [Stylophora pistillata]|uniref:Peptidase aspartic putative domain-containing protein n=1 Tax=Stylophora pistillata TaxID=50429 RepID=A0A2B4RUU9_STYPI|nr:hypothetical protein AWC38_SpisGene14574 [Stylophora pistillata]